MKAHISTHSQGYNICIHSNDYKSKQQTGGKIKMQRRILWFVVLALLAALPEPPLCLSAESGNDAIFVSEPGQKGVYQKNTGRIMELTSNELILMTGSNQLLYEREAVRRVELEPDIHTEDIHALVRIYWNQQESEIVKAVQNTPIIGPFLSFLDDLSGAARMFLAVLVLFGLILYATYKLYEMLVVTANLRNLNTIKLNMEVRKLRYDLKKIENKLGVAQAVSTEKPAPEEMEKETFPFRFEIPKVRILDFIKYKILRMFPEEEKKRRIELWRQKWRAIDKKSSWHKEAVYYSRLTLNLLGTIVAFMFSAGFIVDVFLPFVEPTIFNGASPLISLVFLVFSIISVGSLLRLFAQRRIMRSTYREKPPPAS
jgi:hypothetical protein